MSIRLERPRSMKELLATLAVVRRHPHRLLAGGTDLLLELRRAPVEDITLISLNRVADARFTDLRHSTQGTWIGAMTTAAMLAAHARVAKQLPVLHQAAEHLASTQIREVATVGGNIGTASPSGDLVCALMALDAQCTIVSAVAAKRITPLRRFFTGPRTTVLRPGELLLGLRVPPAPPGTKQLRSGFNKVGTRRAMECSVVSLAHHVQLDADGSITRAGVAFGACAPTVRVPEEACALLHHRRVADLTSTDAMRFADAVVAQAAPITDLRATAWYRKEALRNLCAGMVEDLAR